MTTMMAAPKKTFVPRKLLERLHFMFGRTFATTSDPKIPDLFPYQKRETLLTPRETAFYQVLLAVAGRRVVVSPRVWLADVFSITPTKEHKAFYDRIANRSVDFL